MCITGVQVLNGKTVSGTYRVMLREATQEEIGQNTVLDDYWCPPGLNSVDELNVVTAGKNLIHYNDSLTPKTVLGITFMPNADGSITVNGTATGDADYYIVGKTFNNGVNNYLPRRQVVLSGSHSNVIIQLWGRTKQNTSTGSARANNVDVVIPADSGVFDAELIVIYLTVPNGITVDNAVIYPQLELGSTATDYEPPNVTTTPIDLQGHTLNALPDGTRDELHIDGGGNVVLEKRVGEVVLDGDENIEWTAGRIGIDNGAPGSATSTSIAKDGNAFCDKLPVAEVTSRVAIISYSSGWVDIRNDGVITDAASGRQFLQSNNTTYIYPLATPQTIDLGTITPPTMAAPNVTAYVADDTPAEMTLDYVRDVNIVHSRLEERVAALELASATS